jgi:lipopolysaccharide export system protein LptA
MRRTRPLLLLLILGILAFVATTYVKQTTRLAREAPAKPPALPDALSALARDWSWQETRGGLPAVKIRARDFREIAGGSRIELDQVTLQLYHKDSKVFDEVKSAKAEFNVGDGVLFSDGEVTITMGVDEGAAQQIRGKLMTIKASGVRFESKTGKATTDRAASFLFDRGEGKSVGASYDPAVKELHMNSNVELLWRGNSPSDTPMHVQAGSLVYKEAESKVLLSPWSKFQRNTLTMEAADSLITLEDGVIRLVESQKARGTETQEKRNLAFAADDLRLNLNEQGVVYGMTGQKNASLLSRAPAGVTSVNANRLDMEFDAVDKESILRKALATGNSVVESKPVLQASGATPDTRIIRSDIVSLYMRQGGEEIDRMETESPGAVEFVPNRPGGKHRLINGERLYMHYGPDNQVEKFRAVSVATKTTAETPPGKPPQPPALTWSKDMLALFDIKTGAVTKIEQWENFRYEEGDRRAKADKATLESAKDEITLNGSARVWDATGSTAANQIVMHQQSGDFEADGNVSSTRMPEKKKQGKDGLLASGEPIQATATQMRATENNRRILYEGKALMWQGPNRIQGDRIRIDRETGLLEARGNVISQLIDKDKSPKQAAGKARGVSLFTMVKAPEMDYFDKDRLAHYRGGAVLNRSETVVDAKEIRAFLKAGEDDTSLDKAFADGDVKIVQKAPDRTRTGVGEHAEFYTADGKVILSGGKPQFSDSVKGVTRGSQLTWFSNNDRLLVQSSDGQLVESKLLRK